MSKTRHRIVPRPAPRPPNRGGTARAGKLKTEPDVAFANLEFTKLLEGKGLTFRWSRVLKCPCANPETNTFDPTHVACKGLGYLYVHPYAAEHRYSTRDYLEIAAAFSSGRADPTEQQQGPVVQGSAQITVDGVHKVHTGDRFIGIDQFLPWTELLIRDTSMSVVPVGRFGLARGGGEDQQRATRYRPIKINYVRGLDTSYWEHTDFRLVRETAREPARFEWLPGRGPSDGERYTIHYLAHPVWEVQSEDYQVQHLYGWPDAVGGSNGVRGAFVLQHLPTTYRVLLDWLVSQEGS